MRNFVLSSFLTIISTSQLFADCSQSCNALFQESRVTLGYSTGKYISIDQDYSEIGLFAPLSISSCYNPFFDIHGYRFNDGKWAASTGFGIRRDLCECSALGINAYYDYRKGKCSGHDFHQLGFGFEWLNNCWDVRVNGYFPFLRTQASHFHLFDQLGDGFFATCRSSEYAYSGFDAEFGMPLLSHCGLNLYAAAGPYYYSRSHQNHFFGGYGRLELDWRSILSLQIRMSHDNVYSTNVQGIIQISFPLDFCWDNWGCDRLVNQPVRRNGIILMDRCCNWTWNWDDVN